MQALLSMKLNKKLLIQRNKNKIIIKVECSISKTKTLNMIKN